MNCISLAAYDYSDRDNKTIRNEVINILGLVFNAIFILEFLIKVIAKGFIIHKHSYLRDGWNIIDFIVVIFAIFDFMPFIESKGIKGLRAFRALRPLRSINAIPSMKKLVKILLISLPNLANVVALLGFIILLFAILGLN